MPLSRRAEPTPREAVADENVERLGDEMLELPRHRLAEHGVESIPAYELLRGELLLDGSARLNLATFVTTWMPEVAGRLMADTADKNMIDKDEYPQTAEIEARCVNILSDLWNAPRGSQPHGLLDDRIQRGGACSAAWP